MTIEYCPHCNEPIAGRDETKKWGPDYSLVMVGHPFWGFNHTLKEWHMKANCMSWWYRFKRR